MTKILVLDTETTGTSNHPEHGHPQIVELGSIDITKYDFEYLRELTKEDTVKLTHIAKIFDFFYIQKYYVERFKPSMEIHPEAYNIHNIAFSALVNCRPSEECKIPVDTTYIIGHNISYDYRCLGKQPEKAKLLCTMKLAKKLSKMKVVEYENVKLDTLIKFHYPKEHTALITEKHTAIGDCMKTLLYLSIILNYMKGLSTWEDLYNFQERK